MIKAIATRARADGTFDNVGMNNRLPITDLKTGWGVRRRALQYSKGGPVRIEFFMGRFDSEPYKVVYLGDFREHRQAA